eukprot:1339736-Alexandrium_andersonii.AAC.1
MPSAHARRTASALSPAPGLQRQLLTARGSAWHKEGPWVSWKPGWLLRTPMPPNRSTCSASHALRHGLGPGGSLSLIHI